MTHDLVTWYETPPAKEIYLIAGWRQWADAGAISSNMPQYLIDHMYATKVAEIDDDGFYLFQIPGTHHLLRPQVKLDDGLPRSLEKHTNEFYYAGNTEKGLLIFIGDEPHLRAERYAEAFFSVLEKLQVKRSAIVGGVYGGVPHDKDRQISCTYSLRKMKTELDDYAVRFSNYEGGATISAYFVDQAARRDMECLVFHVLVPVYDFSHLSEKLEGIGLDNDFKAWYDLMGRFNHMFQLDFDLTDLARESDQLITAMDERLDALDKRLPQLQIKQYVDQITADFTERPFMPNANVWTEAFDDLGLDDLFNDDEDRDEDN
ncbi:MAG: PAC2 family protein [Chloroflexota bacterium]